MASEANSKTLSDDDRPECRYGTSCYRRNPDHFVEFRHPDDHASKQLSKRPHSPDSVTPKRAGSSAETEETTDSKSPSKKPRKTDSPSETQDSQPSSSASSAPAPSASTEEGFGLYLSVVRGIGKQWNEPNLSKDVQGILSMDAEDLVSSIQFNYMFDIPWLINKYPPVARRRPILIVTAARNQAEAQVVRMDALQCNERHGTLITLALASLPITYGTHHTKMMILKYNTGVRVVVHTANMIEEDWDQKTQGIYITPLLPKLDAAATSNQPSGEDNFKDDLIEYLRAYKMPALDSVARELETYDMSSVKVKLVSSVPGRFQGAQMSKWGHGKLRTLLKKYVSASTVQSDWTAVAQFSSIGSLGATPDQWLMEQFRDSLIAVQGQSGRAKAPLHLIFPTVENVRTSLEGYSAGGSLPYQKANADKQKYLKQFLHQWRSECRGRSRASPHIKTYFRISPSLKKLGWFLLSSANLSKAAWGAYEKNGTQLMIRSYELGVLFLPRAWGKDDFDVMQPDESFESANRSSHFPLPYDLPLVPYDPDDEPWVTDIQYRQKRDTHGRFWR